MIKLEGEKLRPPRRLQKMASVIDEFLKFGYQVSIVHGFGNQGHDILLGIFAQGHRELDLEFPGASANLKIIMSPSEMTICESDAWLCALAHQENVRYLLLLLDQEEILDEDGRRYRFLCSQDFPRLLKEKKLTQAMAQKLQTLKSGLEVGDFSVRLLNADSLRDSLWSDLTGTWFLKNSLAQVQSFEKDSAIAAEPDRFSRTISLV
jgi:acetylglutamate kinase